VDSLPKFVNHNVNLRFGVIRALKTKRWIRSGEELLAMYGYKFDKAPVWYKDNFLKFMDEHPGTVSEPGS
jgi:hypothetical protein